MNTVIRQTYSRFKEGASNRIINFPIKVTYSRQTATTRVIPFQLQGS